MSTQRRPTHTTTADCRIRGGEYVAYDRADAKSALKVWLDAAQSGDPDAQNNVGEIYERGLGDTPDYAAAVIWYQKAADQGYARAQFNLGTLYEKGLGVEQDRLKALNLYRQAWGLPADSLIYQDTADQQVEKLRAELDAQVAAKDAQVEALSKQIGDLKAQLSRKSSAQAGADATIAQQAQTLAGLLEALKTERARNQTQLAQLPPARTREPRQHTARDVPPDPQAYEHFVKGLNFGRYYAIIIGNQNYQNLDPLQTPRTDAERAAKLLREKYGFNVRVLEDASDDTMLAALNDLNEILKDQRQRSHLLRRPRRAPENRRGRRRLLVAGKCRAPAESAVLGGQRSDQQLPGHLQGPARVGSGRFVLLGAAVQRSGADRLRRAHAGRARLSEVQAPQARGGC